MLENGRTNNLLEELSGSRNYQWVRRRWEGIIDVLGEE